jgi:HPt (histidine-containing phosphotransfer) domain-containing protein
VSEDPLAALRAEYRAALPQRLQAIEQLRAALAAGTLPAGQRLELQRQLHSLAGSGKTFGLPEVSATARAAEALLEAPGEPDWTELERLVQAIARLVP